MKYRLATGDVEWPTVLEPGQPVPLAVITVDLAGNVKDGPFDCRQLFAPRG